VNNENSPKLLSTEELREIGEWFYGEVKYGNPDSGIGAMLGCKLLAHIERLTIAIRQSMCNRCGFGIDSKHANPTGKYKVTKTGIYCNDCEPHEEKEALQ
jgi:hypothetical protein